MLTPLNELREKNYGSRNEIFVLQPWTPLTLLQDVKQNKLISSKIEEQPAPSPSNWRSSKASFSKLTHSIWWDYFSLTIAKQELAWKKLLCTFFINVDVQSEKISFSLYVSRLLPLPTAEPYNRNVCSKSVDGGSWMQKRKKKKNVRSSRCMREGTADAANRSSWMC